MVNHVKKVLHQVVQCLYCFARLAHGCQVILFCFLQIVWYAEQQPNRFPRGELLQRRESDIVWICPFLLKGIEIPIDHASRALVSLSRDFSMKLKAIALSLLPPFKHGGRIGIKAAFSFAISFGFRGNASLLEPVTNSSLFHAKLACDLFERSGAALEAQGPADSAHTVLSDTPGWPVQHCALVEDATVPWMAAEVQWSVVRRADCLSQRHVGSLSGIAQNGFNNL